MSDWGVFAVDRGIWDHPVLADEKEPLSKREAWMWICSAAAWKQINVGHVGSVVKLERAEFCFSLRFLADKFRWQKSRVERFLEKLEKHDMLQDTSRDGAKVYKVLNYNKYQIVGLPERDTKQDANRDATGTPSGRDRDKEETFKHSNIESNPPSGGSAREADEPPAKPASKPKTTNGTRWPSDAVVPDDWIADAAAKRAEFGLPRIDLRYEAMRFANYWASKSGGKGVHADWGKTWMNWATDKDKTASKQGQNARKSTALDSHLAGIAMLIEGDSEPGRD